MKHFYHYLIVDWSPSAAFPAFPGNIRNSSLILLSLSLHFIKFLQSIKHNIFHISTRASAALPGRSRVRKCFCSEADFYNSTSIRDNSIWFFSSSSSSSLSFSLWKCSHFFSRSHGQPGMKREKCVDLFMARFESIGSLFFIFSLSLSLSFSVSVCVVRSRRGVAHVVGGGVNPNR